MKIQPLSNGGGNLFSSKSVQPNQPSIFERRISELQKQITTLKESKQDVLTNSEKIKELEKQIAELQKQHDLEKLQERKKEAEEAQKKLAEKLEREASQQKEQDPHEAVFSLKARNLLESSQQYGDVKTLRKVQSQLPTRIEREAFAPKITAKAFETQRKLAQATKEESKLVRELERSQKTEENAEVDGTKAADSDAAVVEDIHKTVAPLSSSSEHAVAGESPRVLQKQSSLIDIKI